MCEISVRAVGVVKENVEVLSHQVYSLEVPGRLEDVWTGVTDKPKTEKME